MGISMNKLKRMLAILAVVVIVGLYLVTLFCAIFVKQVTGTMFLASLVATVMVPLLLYLVFWLCSMFQSRENTKRGDWDKKTRKGFDEAAAFNKKEKKRNEDRKQDGDTSI